MPNCTVTIEYLSQSSGGNITGFTDGNGVSIEIPSVPVAGGNFFILGVSELGGSDVLGSFNGWIGQENSDSATGVLSNTKIVINGTDIDHFSLYFDSVAKQWATLIAIDGVEYENNDALFYWQGESADSHTVEFRRWNTFGYPARLTAINTGIVREYTRREIKSLVRGSELFSTPNEPSYGVLPQYGSLEIYDTDGEILEYARKRILDKNQSVVVRLDGEIIAKYLTDEWDYQYGSTIVKVSLIDDLSALDNNLFPGYNRPTKETALGLLDYINIYSGLAITIADSVKSRLSSITISEPWMTNSSVRVALDNFCKMSMTYLVVSQGGNATLYDDFSVGNEKDILPSVIIGSPKSQLVTNNVINGVSITENSTKRVDNDFNGTITSSVEYGGMLYATVTNKFTKQSNEKERWWFATSKDGSAWTETKFEIQNNIITVLKNARGLGVHKGRFFVLCDYTADLSGKESLPPLYSTIKKETTTILYSDDFSSWYTCLGLFSVKRATNSDYGFAIPSGYDSTEVLYVFNTESYSISTDDSLFAVGYYYYVYRGYSTPTINLPNGSNVLFGEMVGDWTKKSDSYLEIDFAKGSLDNYEYSTPNNRYNAGAYSDFVDEFINYCNSATDRSTKSVEKCRCYFGQVSATGKYESSYTSVYYNRLTEKKSSENISVFADEHGNVLFSTRNRIYLFQTQYDWTYFHQYWESADSDSGLNLFSTSYVWGISNYGNRYFVSLTNKSVAAHTVVVFNNGLNDAVYSVYFSFVTPDTSSTVGYRISRYYENIGYSGKFLIYPALSVDKAVDLIAKNDYNVMVKKVGMDGGAFAANILELTDTAFTAFVYNERLLSLLVYGLYPNKTTNDSGGTENATVTKIYTAYEWSSAYKTKIETESAEKTYGDTKNVYTFEENELIRQGTTIDGKKIADYLAEKVLENFNVGLQEVEITCAVGKFEQLHKISDVVTPYVAVDKPFSYYAESGNPKKFRIYSAEYNYNGKHKQVLKMLEVKELNG